MKTRLYTQLRELFVYVSSPDKVTSSAQFKIDGLHVMHSTKIAQFTETPLASTQLLMDHIMSRIYFSFFRISLIVVKLIFNQYDFSNVCNTQYRDSLESTKFCLDSFDTIATIQVLP